MSKKSPKDIVEKRKIRTVDGALEAYLGERQNLNWFLEEVRSSGIERSKLANVF